MRRRRVVLALCCAAGGLALDGGATAAHAQRLSGWIDARAIYSRPPAQVTASAATYGVVGARLRAMGQQQELLDVTLQGGRGLDARDGSWLAGSVVGEFSRRLGEFSVGGRIEGFGLDYTDRFSYAAYGVGLRPHIAMPLGSLALTVRGDFTRGRSHSAATPGALSSRRSRQPPAAQVEGRLAVTGGAVELARPLDRGWLLLTAEHYRGFDGEKSGWFTGAGAQLLLSAGALDGRLGLGLWKTPLGTEAGYHATLAYEFASDLHLRFDVGRSVRDPLYGVPGNFTASLGMSWEVGRVGDRATPLRSLPVVVMGERAGEGSRRVRFQLWMPGDAEVALAGDFTDWEPQPMRRYGEIWMLELVLGPGVHHFGFVLDGERWLVPEGAPGVVEDGWGRKNASVVIEQS